MSNNLATTETKVNTNVSEQSKAELISALVLNGDISQMSPEMQVRYYNELCHSLNLNPVTKPFQKISFQGKTVLYATKDATEQLRKLNGVSVIDLQQEIKDGLIISKCKVQDNSGRFDIATGVVNLGSLSGNDKANAIMKSETKAKRRATLSICGLGILDESELDTMPVYKTSDISQISESKSPTFAERFIQYVNTLKSAIEVKETYEKAIINKSYANLSDSEKSAMDLAYLDKLNEFEKVEMNQEVIEPDFSKPPIDIANEIVETFDAVEVKEVDYSEMKEFKELAEKKTITSLKGLYESVTGTTIFNSYDQKYKDAYKNHYDNCAKNLLIKTKK